jgi:hypothetical protein
MGIRLCVVWTEGKDFEAAFLWRTAHPKSRPPGRHLPEQTCKPTSSLVESSALDISFG